MLFRNFLNDHFSINEIHWKDINGFKIEGSNLKILKDNKEFELVDKNKFIGGVGLGVRIPIPILQSLRIDVGWGIKDNKLINEHSFHFAVQQKF